LSGMGWSDLELDWFDWDWFDWDWFGSGLASWGWLGQSGRPPRTLREEERKVELNFACEPPSSSGIVSAQLTAVLTNLARPTEPAGEVSPPEGLDQVGAAPTTLGASNTIVCPVPARSQYRFFWISVSVSAASRSR
jgi:hypothetical protein